MFRKLRQTKSFRLCAGVILAASVLLFSACGLNELVFLFPIQSGLVTQFGNGLLFYHNTANNLDEFLGYEIFYKFYSGDVSSALTADRNYFYARFIASESAITSQGFQPLYRTGYQDGVSGGMLADPLRRPTKPFLSVPGRTIPYAYVISFPAIPPTTLPLTDEEAMSASYHPTFKIFAGAVGDIDAPNAQFFLYRMPNPAQQNYRKSFAAWVGSIFEKQTPPPALFISGYSFAGNRDPDLAQVSDFTPSQGGPPLFVSLCVVAYGRDQNFLPLYSEAVVLNYGPNYPIQVQF